MIDTPRLRLVPATPDMLRADLEGPAALAALLGVEAPTQWPPELYDADAIRWTLDAVERDPDGWYLQYFLRKGPGGEPDALVGVGGYKGGPKEGAVEVGYAVLEPHRRRGYASEAVEGMVARAFADPRVERVIAHTVPELAPSIGVLERCGFRFLGTAEEGEDEEGAIAYERRRD